MTSRVRVLPATGRALVSTDLHGNRADFEALAARFASLGDDAHWVLLGDLVHGPSPAARARNPDLYDFDDESPTLIDRVTEMRERLPNRVHYVLGNHDHGHVGGPHTSKFHPDEVVALEARLSADRRSRMCALFESALLAVAAPCGLLMTHGSPGQALDRLDRLDEPSLRDESDPAKLALLRSVLTDYGQLGAITDAMLASISRPGLVLHVVVHGHDRAESGYFVEGGNQICPVIFGAPRELKRCLVIDLAARYRSPDDLREGIELVRVHG